MIKDCRSFERRIQQLMDSRIDPETDEALWQHGALCDDCYRSLMACSLMHSEFLNDSDSMKIKLDTLGLQEFQRRAQQDSTSSARYLVGLVASLAAMILLSVFLLPEPVRDVRPLAQNNHAVNLVHQSNDSSGQAAESFSRLRQALDPYEITSLTSDWSPIKPIQTLSVCLDWIQKTWRRDQKSVSEPASDLNEWRSELLQVDMTLVALG